jgi:hypothetical protein
MRQSKPAAMNWGSECESEEDCGGPHRNSRRKDFRETKELHDANNIVNGQAEAYPIEPHRLAKVNFFGSSRQAHRTHRIRS